MHNKSSRYVPSTAYESQGTKDISLFVAPPSVLSTASRLVKPYSLSIERTVIGKGTQAYIASNHHAIVIQESSGFWSDKR